MRKGQVVGGQGTAEKPRRGMLPPTGNGPIEVTRETLEDSGKPENDPAPEMRDIILTSGQQPPKQQSATSPAKRATQARDGLTKEGLQLVTLLPPEVIASLEARLPEASADLRTVISACEKRLHAAGLLHDSLKKKTLSAYFYFAGPAVRLAYATQSWQSTVDPATGRPCRSWSAWLRSVNVSRQHAERMTKEEPLMEALKGLEVKQLNTTQIDAMAPVLNNHGVSGVRKLWVAALGWGDVSGPSLLRLRAQLGLEPDRVISEGDAELKSTPDLPVLRFQTKAGTFDAAQVREVARHQPEIARLVAQTILDELGPGEPAEDGVEG